MKNLIFILAFLPLSVHAQYLEVDNTTYFPVSQNALISLLDTQDMTFHEERVNLTPNELLTRLERDFTPDIARKMLIVSYCESRLRQFVDGKVLISDTQDYGLYQINEIWQDRADELGLNFKDSVEDNIKMAIEVYKVQGLKAWTCAKIHSL